MFTNPWAELRVLLEEQTLSSWRAKYLWNIKQEVIKHVSDKPDWSPKYHEVSFFVLWYWVLINTLICHDNRACIILSQYTGVKRFIFVKVQTFFYDLIHFHCSTILATYMYMYIAHPTRKGILLLPPVKLTKKTLFKICRIFFIKYL